MSKKKFKMETSDKRQLKAWMKEVNVYLDAFICAVDDDDGVDEELIVKMNKAYEKVNRYQLKIISWKKRGVETSYVK